MNEESRGRRNTQRSGWDEPERYSGRDQYERQDRSDFESRRQAEQSRYREMGRAGEEWPNASSGVYGQHSSNERPYYGHGEYGYAAERDNQTRDYGSPWDQRRATRDEDRAGDQWGRSGMPDRASGTWEGSREEQQRSRPQDWQRQGMPDRASGRTAYERPTPRRDERWDREEDSPYYIGREGQPSYPHSQTDWDRQRQYRDEVGRFGDQYRHEDRWHRGPVRSEDFRVRSLPSPSDRVRARREAEQRRLGRRDQRQNEASNIRDHERDRQGRERGRMEPTRSSASTLERSTRQGKAFGESRRKQPR